MSDKPRELRNLMLDRVDLVKAPANPDSKVLLFKQEDEVEKGMTRHDVDKRVVSENGKFVVYDREGKKKLGTYDSKEEAVARLRQIEGFKKQSATLGGMSVNFNRDDLPEDVRKHLEDLEAANTDLSAKVDELTAQPPAAAATAEADEVAKSELAQIQKALEDERSARLASEERIAKMEAERKLATFVSLAKADLEPLGKADELGAVLLTISEVAPEDTFKSLQQILKGAAAQLATGDLFKQRASVTGEPTDAETKIDELAKEAVKAGIAKTVEQGKLHVLKTNPELYAEYRASRDA